MPPAMCRLEVRASAMPSCTPPIICASRPRGLTANPASTTTRTFVTRGPVTPSATGLLAVAGVQSISARTAIAPWYSL
jgi:hypothetical protein